MNADEINMFLKQHAEKIICEYCADEYGNIPQNKNIPTTAQSIGALINGKTYWYYRDRVHCIICSHCNNPERKEKAHKPLGDAPICDHCYNSIKKSESSYTFESDLGE